MTGRTRGFTLIEMMVVAILGSLLLMAVLQTMITNQRTYTAQGARIQGQQVLRATADVLFGEIREISPQGGDLLSMTSSAMTVRSMRKFGVVCGITTSSPPALQVARVGEWFEDGDSTFIFADNDPTIEDDDAWIRARVTGVDTTAACGTTPAQSLTFAGQGGVFAADSVRPGAPVRSHVRYTYGLIVYGGKSYLGRTDRSGTTVPLVGPLGGASGLRFVYMDSLGAVTTIRSNVRQVGITIRTSSEARDSHGRFVSDSVTTLVFTRN